MKRAGIALLLLVVAVVVGYRFLQRPTDGTTVGGGTGNGTTAGVTVKGSIGGEKAGFLRDPDVVRILRERHGLEVDFARAGSIEMVKGKTDGQDFLWPSSQVALELYQQAHGRAAKSQVVFNSPIVLYSRQLVTDALVKNGIAEKVNGTYYVVQFPRLIRMVSDGKPWKELGLTQLYGKMIIITTDPTRSNSGNQFAALLANMLNGGEVVDEQHVSKVLPGVQKFFSRQGYMQESSGDLFSQFLQQGVGSFPIIVGYEAQLVEFGLENPQYGDLLHREVTTLYPKPTLWSSHPLIALTPNGEKLLNALQDPEIQRLAWEKHGFRSGMLGVQNDPKLLKVAGIPPAIENVMPMPTARVMDRIITSLGKH